MTHFHNDRIKPNSADEPTTGTRNRTSQPTNWARSLALVLLGAGFATTGTYFAWGPGAMRESVEAEPTVQPVVLSNPFDRGAAPPQPRVTPTNPNFVTQVVNEVGPAVVRIDASRTVRSQFPGRPGGSGLRGFNGVPMPPQEEIQQGVGSGFIISDNGQIITNAHVIDGADRVQVTLQDGRTYEGEVLGVDPVTDVAVVKIQAEDLPTVRLSSAEAVQPGEWAIAIGNPLGLDSTVTVGIISAIGRSSNQVGVPDKRVDFIQTDAAINPGNSGGPLLNEEGEVIGMNTAIIQGAQGIGFAIPIDTVQRIANQLIETGRVEHPYLGVQMLTLTPELREEINQNPNGGLTVTEDSGVLIAEVVPNSPAATAGLRSGDIILRINDEPIEDAEDVQRIVEESSIGAELQVEVNRNGDEVAIAVRPGALPEQAN